jgi:hypothetical protein
MRSTCEEVNLLDASAAAAVAARPAAKLSSINTRQGDERSDTFAAGSYRMLARIYDGYDG